jgi:type I restriction enzyme R subunit
MYVDRKLAGLQAVQTLSRLNRTRAAKKSTYILDFQNSIEDIQEAFRPYFQATTLEETSDPNQVYELEAKLRGFGILDQGEIDRFAEVFFSKDLSSQDRIYLEGLVREAVNRFSYEEDEGKQEEFRQLLKSFMRFYAFVAQIISLGDNNLEKLYAYSAWLARLLPNREVPPEIEITDEMLELQAFKVAQQEAGSASLGVEESKSLFPIQEFGAKAYTPEEEKSLSEIIDSFNDRHGTSFSKEDFLRFEQVNREIMNDDMLEMLRNNPPDVVFSAFSNAFFRGAIRMFQRDSEMKNIILTDEKAREQAIQHFFSRALREARESA